MSTSARIRIARRAGSRIGISRTSTHVCITCASTRRAGIAIHGASTCASSSRTRGASASAGRTSSVGIVGITCGVRIIPATATAPDGGNGE